MNKCVVGIIITILCCFLAVSTQASVNETDSDSSKTTSGLPLPRFASLRTNDINMRTGPGTRYPILWVFSHQGLPVEIIAEYEIWRRIRDPDGSEGWVHKTSLSGKRSAIVIGGTHELRTSREDTAPIAAHLEAGAVGQLLSCAKDWCKLKFDGNKGFLRKSDFWGAYPNEVFD